MRGVIIRKKNNNCKTKKNFAGLQKLFNSKLFRGFLILTGRKQFGLDRCSRFDTNQQTYKPNIYLGKIKEMIFRVTSEGDVRYCEVTSL